MKTKIFFISAFYAMACLGQVENSGEIRINETQPDDTYKAGETIKVDAVVQGDLIIAGGNLTVNDSVNGDLTAAGGELYLRGYVADDARLAFGRATIDSEIGDDLIIFGGEVTLTENAVVQGNLRFTGGKINMKGKVLGDMTVKGGDVLIDGSIRGTSKIIAEDLSIGPNAKFFKEVQYYSEDGEIDFNTALVLTEAQFNEDLADDASDLSMTTLGTKSLKMWLFYILSSFLVILVLHALFKDAFSNAVADLDHHWLKHFGIGLIYLIGIPIAILIAFLLVIGIPLGLFTAAVFIFSLLLGHMVAALLLAYYLRNKKDKAWGFWAVTLLALLFVIVLRALTMIPFAGIVLSIVVLAITYGALTLKVVNTKRNLVPE
jgi:cytoskeletal protein CcmA (bactofilin family)